MPPFAFTCDFCAPAWRASVYVMLLCVHLFVLFASPGFGWKSFGASMVMFGLAWRWFGHAWARLASFGSSRFTFGPLELIGHVCVVRLYRVVRSWAILASFGKVFVSFRVVWSYV